MKWTPNEEEALRAGVAKYGNGRWKKILSDSEFASSLLHRSNVDLKDKWRNMICGISRKSRIPRVKETAAIPHSNVQNAAPAVTLSVGDVLHKSAKNSPDEKKVFWYYDMIIFEALSTIKDSNGLDFGAIISLIELQQKQEMPLYLRRLLSSKLGRLVLQGRVNRIKNRYKINDGDLGMRTPSPKQKDIRPRSLENPNNTISSKIKDAASSAALLIMDAENKSFVAAEAVEEVERVSNIAEDAEAMLDLAKQIYQHSSRGERALVA